MPEISIDNNKLDVDSETIQRVKNVLSKDSISKYLDKYWTDSKLGKHKDMKARHGEILLKNLKGPVDEFFEKLADSNLHVELGKEYKFSSLLSRTGFDEYLKDSYIEDAMSVTTTRPSIGRGEFLIASLFHNIGFARKSGDLVILNTGENLEVKGPRAILGNGQNDRFRALSKSVLYSVLQHAKIDDMPPASLTVDYVQELKQKLGPNEQAISKCFVDLQNLEPDYDPLGRIACSLYKEKKQFLRVVAAEHLFAYANVQNIDYILFHDNRKFAVFARPDNLQDAYSIVDRLDVHCWNIGDYGVKVSLK